MGVKFPWLCRLLFKHDFDPQPDEFGQHRCRNSWCGYVPPPEYDPQAVRSAHIDGRHSLQSGSAIKERALRPEQGPYHPEEGVTLLDKLEDRLEEWIAERMSDE